MENKDNQSLSQDNKEPEIRQADLPVNPAQPDEEPYDDAPEPINWKERLYDRIPNKKTALRVLDVLIPLLFVLIILFLILGSR